MRVDHDEARGAFLAGLDGFVTAVTGLTDRDLMANSRCTGWTVGDVVVHVHMGLQEMLLGLVTGTDEPTDTDADGYWRSPPPATDGSGDRETDDLMGMRFVRLVGAAYRRPTGVVRHLLPTVDGVRAATAALRPGAVRFQGRVLRTGDFLATWAVELAVHHLDLSGSPPAGPALRLARLTVEALAQGDLPRSWPDDTAVLLGTGRLRPSAAQRDQAPALVAKFPVLG